MSGGHWNYAGSRIGDDLKGIANDEHVVKNWSEIGFALDFLADWIEKTKHDMDWCISADIVIADNPLFSQLAVMDLLIGILKIVPDNPKLFPRGRWATIQALQIRVNDAQITS